MFCGMVFYMKERKILHALKIQNGLISDHVSDDDRLIVCDSSVINNHFS